jgi:hypothetical protein
MQSEFKKYLLTGLVVVGFLGNVSGLIVKTDILQSPDGKKTVYLYSDLHGIGTEQEKEGQFDYIKTSLEQCDPSQTVVLLEGATSKETGQTIDAISSLMQQLRDRISDIEKIDPSFAKCLKEPADGKCIILPKLIKLSFSGCFPIRIQCCGGRFNPILYSLLSRLIDLDDFHLDPILAGETLESICQEICSTTKKLEQYASKTDSSFLMVSIERFLYLNETRSNFAKFFMRGDVRGATNAIVHTCKTSPLPFTCGMPFNKRIVKKMLKIKFGGMPFNNRIVKEMIRYKNVSPLTLAKETPEFFRNIFNLIEIITYYLSFNHQLSLSMRGCDKSEIGDLGILDIIMLSNILENRDESKVVAFAGLKHTQKISNILLECEGYKTVYSSVMHGHRLDKTFTVEESFAPIPSTEFDLLNPSILAQAIRAE